MVDINLQFPFIENFVKLMNQGRIDKVYLKMYSVAEELAAKDTQHFNDKLISKELEDKINLSSVDKKFDHLTKLWEYRISRTEFHMNEMKRLLSIALHNDIKK